MSLRFYICIDMDQMDVIFLPIRNRDTITKLNYMYIKLIAKEGRMNGIDFQGKTLL